MTEYNGNCPGEGGVLPPKRENKRAEGARR